MKRNHNSLKLDRKSKTSGDISLTCYTNKFGSKKKRLCLKCGKKFLSECAYNRICEECSLTNERIALRTHSVSSKPLGEEDPVFCCFPAWQGGKSANS